MFAFSNKTAYFTLCKNELTKKSPCQFYKITEKNQFQISLFHIYNSLKTEMADFGYNNDLEFGESDEENDIIMPENEIDVKCSSCDAHFNIKEKGVSRLKNLCAQCFLKDKADVQELFDEVEGSKEVNNSKTETVEQTVNDKPPELEPEIKSDLVMNNAVEMQAAVDFNDKETFLASFYSSDASFSLSIGGEEQLYAHKRYHHGPHKCFVDVEVLSHMPLMLNYFLLSAVVTRSHVYYSRCWIEKKKTGKRFVLLCVLRTKCLQVRYDFLLWDPVEDKVSQECGITKMEHYVFLPDLSVDHAFAVEKLKAHIEDPVRKLALLPGADNKDAEGHIIPSGGIDPLSSACLPPRNGKASSKLNPPIEPIKNVPRKRGARAGKKKRKVIILLYFACKLY